MKTKTPDLAKQLNEKPTAQLMCRTLQHSWDVNRGDVERDGRYLLWGLPCVRCETIKTLKIERRTGRSVGASYSYPPDYQLHGLGALSADERGSLRLVLLDRIGSV